MSSQPEYVTPEAGDPASIAGAFADIRRCITRLGEDLPVALDEDSSDVAALELLDTIRPLRIALAELEAYVEAQTAQRLKYGKSQVAGRTVEVHGGRSRTHWHHRNLIRAVCADVIYDKATGEIVPEAAHIVGLVSERIVAAAGISYWRAGKLKEIGVDPDDFSEFVTSRRTVRILADDAERVSA